MTTFYFLRLKTVDRQSLTIIFTLSIPNVIRMHVGKKEVEKPSNRREQITVHYNSWCIFRATPFGKQADLSVCKVIKSYLRRNYPAVMLSGNEYPRTLNLRVRRLKADTTINGK